jgi:transcriptional regulator with XRE-family HTH domain
MKFATLKNIRILAGVPASELARLSGVDRSRLSLFESGTVRLSDSQLSSLMASLRVAIRERIEKLEEGFAILNREEIAAQKAADGAGAGRAKGKG